MKECVFEFIKKAMRKNKVWLKKDFLNQRTKILKKPKKERNLFCIAKEQGYNVLCNGRIIYDHLKAQEYRIKELEKENKGF